MLIIMKKDIKKKLMGVLVFMVIIIISIPVLAWSDCRSNFDCGIGYMFVKEPYKIYGVCMRVVDKYGIPQYNLPRPESIGPRYEVDC